LQDTLVDVLVSCHLVISSVTIDRQRKKYL